MERETQPKKPEVNAKLCYLGTVCVYYTLEASFIETVVQTLLYIVGHLDYIPFNIVITCGIKKNL